MLDHNFPSAFSVHVFNMPFTREPPLPEGHYEISEAIQDSISSLQTESIPVCIVGEIALNYYNVPHIVHVCNLNLGTVDLIILTDTKRQDIELCVLEADLGKPQSILNSKHDKLELSAVDEYNIFTEYKLSFPRFRYQSNPRIRVLIFTDAFCH